VIAVLGGIGLSNGAALSILEENGIPYIGGIPVNEDELKSPVSFQFSGGSPAAFAAFSGQAVQEDGAEKVTFIYADYPSIRFAAEEYGMEVARQLGAEVEGIAYPMVSQDYSAPIQKAVEGKPDVIVAAAADLACQPVMQALVDLNTEATVYMVGSCASPDVVEQVGAADLAGFRFNIENRLDQTADSLADTEIYSEVMQRYVPETEARSAATVAFKAAMNLWAVLNEIGADVTSQDILDAFGSAVDRSSFDGHSYTCDGQQLSAYPSVCSPQQILAELQGENEFVEISDGWVDVPAIVAETIG
jgi:branched-chain amino acid transport system substrate-binding protein